MGKHKIKRQQLDRICGLIHPQIKNTPLPPCPLVVLFSGTDRSMEMSILGDLATVAFCDALILQICSGYDHVDLKDVGQLRITTISHILHLYLQNTWLYQVLQEGTLVQGVEEIQVDTSQAARVHREMLGLIGLSAYFRSPTSRMEQSSPWVCRRSAPCALCESDCVSLSCNLSEHHHHLTKDFTGKHRRHVPCECSLKEGRTQGAALEGHESEPFSFARCPLKDALNLTCKPHIAWCSERLPPRSACREFFVTTAPWPGTDRLATPAEPRAPQTATYQTRQPGDPQPTGAHPSQAPSPNQLTKHGGSREHRKEQ
ncbi:unnamed protein product [Nyctereutes procyonoides]|uniref:(raccoon dog) hypothetical protein n=1 Tax=Nyctereutes procyonoides TaxID=34880 RepID=A0A811Y4J8_NYCPR|nr:unnamed protein product [Nyctereutes procyonoides]